jgi:hypothetical protein
VAREAVRLDPVDAQAHFLLGYALREKGELGEAIECFREAARLAPALPVYRRALGQTERWRELLPRLAAVAARPAEPKRPFEILELLELARLCREPFQKRYALATRLYAGVFAGTFASSRYAAQEYGYDAARCAALAAAGRDSELTAVGVEEWGRLTGLARRWLRADLALRAAQARDPSRAAEVRELLNHWKEDPDLAAVRDPAWLAAMPAPDRAEWVALWADVDAVLATAARPPAKQ